MTRKLKPVDDTPICDPACLTQIDPVWLARCVPKGFWDDGSHRRDYLLWLADGLGYRGMADFYRLGLTKARVRQHRYKVVGHWGSSAWKAVQDCFPEYDWKPWLFPALPRGFWDVPANRRSYMDWLGEQLRYRTPEAWYQIRTEDFNRYYGLTLLQRFASLYDLMREYLPGMDWDRINPHRPFVIDEILCWADEYYGKHGAWPTAYSGIVPERGDTWKAIDKGLRQGLRGLSGGTSLPRLLEKHRGIPVGKSRPKLSEERILSWADAYFAKGGKWPTAHSGTIADTRETWLGVNHALARGTRGLPGGSSLARFLIERRDKRVHLGAAPLTEEQVLGWADAYFTTQGKWPRYTSGAVPGTRETWNAIDSALRAGIRGLGPRSSLALLLAERRGARHNLLMPQLTEEHILGWADAYFAAYGKWPNKSSGAISGTSETWNSADRALGSGGRGLRRRSSLAKLLEQRRGVRNQMTLPPLSEKQILAWADAYFRANQKWPTQSSGRIAGTEENWASISDALRLGRRGVGPGSSLAQLLAQRRGKPNHLTRPPLSEAKILAWAHRFFLSEGRWPAERSGSIPQSPGDNWNSIQQALVKGRRGLPGGSSLAKLLRKNGLK